VVGDRDRFGHDDLGNLGRGRLDVGKMTEEGVVAKIGRGADVGDGATTIDADGVETKTISGA